MPACRSPSSREPRRHRRQREVGGLAVVDLVPGQRRRHARVGRRPHRVGAGDRAVLRVLVVVEEHAVALFLPPLARRQIAARAARPRAPARAPRGAPRRTSSAARCARRCACRASPTSSASRPGRGRRAWRAPRARRRGSAATRRRAPDRDRRAARRDDRDRRRAPDAGAARGTRGWPSTASAAASRGTTSSAVRPDGNVSATTSIHGGPRLRRALLVEELAADAVRIAHEHVRPSAGAAQRAVGDGEVVAREIELGVAASSGTAPCAGFEIATSRPATVSMLARRASPWTAITIAPVVSAFRLSHEASADLREVRLKPDTTDARILNEPRTARPTAPRSRARDRSAHR